MSGIAIVPFRRELAADFRRLNLEWIEQLFSVEEPDRRVLDDPEGSIVAKGGTLLFAVDDASGEVVGTVAMIRAGAIRLYERLGFRRANAHASDYARADVFMELPIRESGG